MDNGEIHIFTSSWPNTISFNPGIPVSPIPSVAFLNVLFDYLEAMRQLYSPCLRLHLISVEIVLRFNLWDSGEEKIRH